MGNGVGKINVIRCVRMLAVPLKHHLRSKREWSECRDLKRLVAYLPNTNPFSQIQIKRRLPNSLNRNTITQQPTISNNHSVSFNGYPARTSHNTNRHVLTHLPTYIDVCTSIIAACKRLLRIPIPLGYNIANSRIVWIFVFALRMQLWIGANGRIAENLQVATIHRGTPELNSPKFKRELTTFCSGSRRKIICTSSFYWLHLIIGFDMSSSMFFLVRCLDFLLETHNNVIAEHLCHLF
jgi:hypothetical protein